MDRDAQVVRLLTEARPARGAPAEQRERGEPRERSFELYRETGENFRSVCMEIRANHFQLDTHDMGRATEEFWGDSDYEFWATVAIAEWPKLISALAKEVGAEEWAADPETWLVLSPAEQGDLLFELFKALFEGDSRGTDRLRDLCGRHGVEYQGGSWV